MSAISYVFLVLSVTSALQSVHSTPEYVPVFMWGATTSSEAAKALEKVNPDKFYDILSEQLDSKPFTVVFIEETLSVEDFSAKDAEGRTAYPGLREKITGESVIYLPFVSSALHTLNKLADPEKIDRIHLNDDGLSADITPGSGQFLYINLKDAREGEDRLHMLSRHDEFMTTMFDKLLKKHSNVLAMYTAQYPSWEVAVEQSRSRRSLLARPEGEAKPASGFYNGGKVFIYASSFSLTTPESPTEPIALSDGTISTSNGTDGVLEATLTFTNNGSNNALKMKFVNNKGGWWLDVTVADEEMSPKLYAPLKFSYHCSPKTVLASDNYTLTMGDFQAQPFFQEAAASRFNLAYDCVGFTSVPIWSGLFVVFIFIFIVSVGITMMMDIRTMDRFDDPKGKTITIAVTD